MENREVLSLCLYLSLLCFKVAADSCLSQKSSLDSKTIYSSHLFNDPVYAQRFSSKPLFLEIAT